LEFSATVNALAGTPLWYVLRPTQPPTLSGIWKKYCPWGSGSTVAGKETVGFELHHRLCDILTTYIPVTSIASFTFLRFFIFFTYHTCTNVSHEMTMDHLFNIQWLQLQWRFMANLS